MMMALSFFAFMILGTVSADAQWVNTDEAIALIKAEINTLDNAYNQAGTDEAKVEVANELRYFNSLFYMITEEGQEIPTAIEGARLANLAELHSSGLIYFSDDSPEYKTISQGLVDEATDLLSE